MSILTDTLAKGALALGVTLSPAALRSFQAYYDFLSEKNQVMDLTSVAGEAETANRHFLDSLALLRLGGFQGGRLIDVGSGAGFPGLPLRLAVPDMSLTLLDAQAKRVDFLKSLCARLEVRADCLHARAEEQALKPGYRDGFDFAVSRAVARLNLLTELCLPFVKPGGRFLAMKGRDSDEELREAAQAVKLLGGRLLEPVDYELDGVPRRIVVVEKIRETPSGYPRRFAKIQKNPL